MTTLTKQLLAQANEIVAQAMSTAERDYPIGARVMWKQGSGTRRGKVKRHAKTGPRVCVQTDRGSDVWLNLEELLDAE